MAANLVYTWNTCILFKMAVNLVYKWTREFFSKWRLTWCTRGTRAFNLVVAIDKSFCSVPVHNSSERVSMNFVLYALVDV